jgi:hypothetical protein
MRGLRLSGVADYAAVAFVAAAFASIVARPLSRHDLIAQFNDPKDLSALASDPRIHFQPAVEPCAQRVAALLPAAMASVEAQQGRPFAKPPIIGVYASFDDYARANGLGDPAIAAVSRSGRVILSPTLCGEEQDRLPGVLKHELSHTHLFGWRSMQASTPLPSWFSEGLAVTVSNGGAAEGLSEDAARDALRDGYAIAISDAGLWRSFEAIAFERELPQQASQDETLTRRQRLAFREAAMLVAWLRDSNPKGFARLLDRLEDGEAFGDALAAIYGFSSGEGWRRFRSLLSARSVSFPARGR